MPHLSSVDLGRQSGLIVGRPELSSPPASYDARMDMPVYWIVLGACVVVILSTRFLTSRLPLHRGVATLRPHDLGLFALGLLGLGLHCGAMFFPGVTAVLPGTDVAANAIRALGTASIVWYVVPAGLVIVALRTARPVALAAVAVGLLAVGVTMFNGGRLDVHLVAIFAAVVVLALVVATQVRFGRRTHLPRSA